MKLLRRTWADINLDNLSHNYAAIRSRMAADTRFLGVMKADAYGHGAVPMSHRLVELGADYLAVSNIEEAVQIRRGEVRAPILILGHTPAAYAEMMVFMDITQEIHSLEYARQLDQSLRNTNYILNVHVKLDTGLGRIGFSAEDPEIAAQMEILASLQHLHVEGAFTHFSAADSALEQDMVFTREQYRRFNTALDILFSAGIRPEIRHCSNSGAVLLHPEFNMDMVRPGIMTYGVHPSEDTAEMIDLRPVMTLHSTVAQLRQIKAGTPIGYGRTMVAPRDLHMAVIPIGYADGLSRALSNRGAFLLRGRKVPVIGRICMDMCTVDVSDVPDVTVGDRITVFGEDSGLSVSCNEIAAMMDTIPYEILCSINKRIPRIYLSGGRESEVLQYIV